MHLQVILILICDGVQWLNELAKIKYRVRSNISQKITEQIVSWLIHNQKRKFHCYLLILPWPWKWAQVTITSVK